MAINASDIKLLESEVMADTSDGGGRKTSRVIPDGVAGNIFPKVSRLDSVYGRVNMRKIYGSVLTANVDTYAGAHAVVTDAPDNDRIHTLLFSTNSEFDTRAVARDRIESYVTAGPVSRMQVVGKQLTGQATILVAIREDEVPPEIGDVYCISYEPNNATVNSQYFRVQSWKAEIRTFTDDKGDYKRKVVTIDIGAPLRYDFTGPEIPPRSSTSTDVKVRSTSTVDAARYYGIKPLAEVANQNALTLKLASIYAPIVPTTTRETPLSQVAISESVNLIPASTATRSVSVGTWAIGTKRYTVRGMVPGSISVTSYGGVVTKDNKTGALSSSDFVATVDYENGIISRTGGSGGGSYTITYTPGAAIAQPSHTIDIPVTINNRGTVYVQTIHPLPSAGSVILDYRSLGKWYRLRDDGAGSIKGEDSAYGAGTIEYSTGAIVVTLGALPDLDSSILISSGSLAHYTIRAGATSDAGMKVKQTIQLSQTPVQADSFSLSYIAGSTTYTATDDATGAITGGGVTGKINYVTGKVDLEFTTRIPNRSNGVSVSYNNVTATELGAVLVKSMSGDSVASYTLGSQVSPGSFNATIYFGSFPVFVRDNGLGLVVAPSGQQLGDGDLLSAAAMINADCTVGSIDYQTGAVTINNPVIASQMKWTPAGTGEYYWGAHALTLVVGGGTANLGWKDPSISVITEPQTATLSFADYPIRVDLTQTVADSVVPSSLLFSVGGKDYIDRNGILYADVSATTGVGTIAGSVDYKNGQASFSYWTDNAAMELSVVACATQYGTPTFSEVYLRSAGSPLRPASFLLQATADDGTLLQATSDNDGVLTGAKISGSVKQTTGVIRIKFGEMVTAAGNEAEPWYSASSVVGGMIWKPIQIIPQTFKYSTVVLANLPLNADILGLDPVRLPSDGRVPIYRTADVVLIHNTESTTLPNPAVAGATYSAGRSNIAEMWVVDQTGAKIASGAYIADLASGTITLAADLNLGSVQQPLVLKHRIEEMNLLSDVQINGQVTLTAPLSRQFPAGTSYVSSALLFGDMNARVTNIFDLQTFSAWSDTPGTGATANYNKVDYPIEVLNNGAVNERWRINFTSMTAFQVIGENLGVIDTGTTSTDCSPVNQLTGKPYFVIRSSGWGSGWAAGNQLRFNTISTAAPIWIARTVLPGATLAGDSFSLQMRGDVDAV